MKQFLATTAVAALVAAGSIVPAEAGKRHHGGDGYRGHHSHNHGHHRGSRGYYKDGKWIALGILGAAAVQALDDDDECYRTRRGRLVCN